MPALARALDGAVALITGRAIADADRLFPGLSLPIAGQHGTERRGADGKIHRHRLPRPASRGCGASLHGSLPGMRAAARGQGRDARAPLSASPRLAAHVHRTVRTMLPRAARGRAWRMQPGKGIVEIRPDGRDKGTAIAEFMAEPPFRGRMPVFLGDDRPTSSALPPSRAWADGRSRWAPARHARVSDCAMSLPCADGSPPRSRRRGPQKPRIDAGERVRASATPRLRTASARCARHDGPSGNAAAFHDWPGMPAGVAVRPCSHSLNCPAAERVGAREIHERRERPRPQACRRERGHPEAADERPDSAVVVLPGRFCRWRDMYGRQRRLSSSIGTQTLRTGYGACRRRARRSACERAPRRRSRRRDPQRIASRLPNTSPSSPQNEKLTKLRYRSRCARRARHVVHEQARPPVLGQSRRERVEELIEAGARFGRAAAAGRGASRGARARWCKGRTLSAA